MPRRLACSLINFPQLSFWPLRAVFRARLLPVCDPGRVQRPTNHVIANARKVFHTTATDQDDRVFLQIVADTGDVGCNFNPIGQTHTSNFAKGRVRLLWRRRIHASAHASFLRTFLQRRTTRLVFRFLSTLSNQLIKRRHEIKLLKFWAAYQTAKLRPVKPFNLTQKNYRRARGLATKRHKKEQWGRDKGAAPSADQGLPPCPAPIPLFVASFLLSRQPFLLWLFLSSDLLGQFEFRWSFFSQPLLGLFGDQFDVAVKLKPRPGWNETSHDDVLLQAPEVIDFPADRSFRQHASCFLERRSRNERLGRERSLRDSEQQRPA